MIMNSVVVDVITFIITDMMMRIILIMSLALAVPP
jgi:hypothetical protein